MKNVLLLLALSGILLNTFRKEVVLLDYYANKDFIKRVLCINTAKPELQCDGKCYLMSKLRAAEEKKQAEAPAPLQDKQHDIQLFYPQLFKYPGFHFNTSELPDFAYLDKMRQGFLPDILHPPS